MGPGDGEAEVVQLEAKAEGNLSRANVVRKVQGRGEANRTLHLGLGCILLYRGAGSATQFPRRCLAVRPFPHGGRTRADGPVELKVR